MKCVLRKWQLSGAPELAAALNNKNILNCLRDGLPYPYTEQDAREYIDSVLSANENDTFAYAVTLDHRVVGSIGAFRQGNIHCRTAELGYYLAEPFWGRGIMTDAIRQLCDILFASTDLLRLYAEPFSYNIGSRRALEKAGFTLEGTMKNNAVKNGRVTDMCLYSLTRTQEPYPIRRLSPEQIPEAKALCWQVFQEFEAPEYPPQGIAAFRSSLDDKNRTRQLSFYGAFDGSRLVGVLCMRPPRHIGYFFVDPAYQRQGIGRRLFASMRQDYSEQSFTVNSSPYAVEVYRRLGFVPTDTRQQTDGLLYTPMRFEQGV